DALFRAALRLEASRRDRAGSIAREKKIWDVRKHVLLAEQIVLLNARYGRRSGTSSHCWPGHSVASFAGDVGLRSPGRGRLGLNRLFDFQLRRGGTSGEPAG